jgi:acyl-CoA synthetase (AMP-forming)/AMP-acid ligase II
VACDDPDALQVVACGRPLPGYRVRVVDDVGRERPERHEGLLQFQRPLGDQGYYRNPSSHGTLIRGGWHETRAIAPIWPAAMVYLTGRVKDIIIRGGRNLYPYEVEQALGELAGIRRGCVVAFAARDARQGSERLVIVAESKRAQSRATGGAGSACA